MHHHNGWSLVAFGLIDNWETPPSPGFRLGVRVGWAGGRRKSHGS